MKKLFFIFLFLILLPFYSFSQNNLIPNTEDCSSTRPKFDFTIDTAWVSKTGKKVDSRLTPLVGDFDGDGNVEIFAASGLAGGSNGHIYVFDGKQDGKKDI